MHKGTKQTKETRNRISAAKKGKKLSIEHRRKISESLKGRIFSDETRAKIAAAHRGMTYGPETRAKISAAHKGKEISIEHRRSISKALKGRKRSPDAIAKTAAAHRGMKRSKETRAKIGAKSKGRKWTKERRLKQSQMQKGKPILACHTPVARRKRRETWCKNGNMSKGQRKLNAILEEMNVNFESEQYFSFPTGKPRGAFIDVFIPHMNVAIEYDGHQRHYTTAGKIEDAKRDSRMFSIHGVQTLRIERNEIFTDKSRNRITAFLS